MPRPSILDATAGGRMMWFDKNPDDVLFVDRRVVPPGTKGQGSLWEVNPDIVASFESLPFSDDTFEMVVYDPPHRNLSPDSIMGLTYGSITDLDTVVAGLHECLRVSRRWVVFKWAEASHKVSDVLALTDARPLFGHTTAKSGKTIWVVFDATV